MVAENVGPIAAIKQSIHLLGKGWRKLLIVNFLLFLIIAVIVAISCFLAELFKLQIQSGGGFTLAAGLIFSDYG